MTFIQIEYELSIDIFLSCSIDICIIISFIFQVLENILKFSGIPENIENVTSENIGKKYDLLNSRYGHELIGILAEHCRDPSLMVRKQVV